jgi:hypothetical protein
LIRSPVSKPNLKDDAGQDCERLKTREYQNGGHQPAEQNQFAISAEEEMRPDSSAVEGYFTLRHLDPIN